MIDYTLQFKQAYWKSERVRKYVASRGITSESLEFFNIGYCTPKMEIPDLEMLQGRLVIPQYDCYGKLIAYHGRALNNRKPKYINSTFHKSKYLYNLDKAWIHILRKGYVIIVEGLLDVVALHKIGIFNVVATCGTSFSMRMVSLLARYTTRALLMLDQDEAGGMVYRRCRERLERSGFYVKSANLTMYKDVDEYVSSGYESAILEVVAKYDNQ